MKRKNFRYYSGKMYDGMLGRCYRTQDRTYKQYGGKGIRVAASWISDTNAFRDWLRSELARDGFSEDDFVTYRSKFSLDRIDPLGPYTPENCRLTSLQEQSRNQIKRKRKLVLSA